MEAPEDIKFFYRLQAWSDLGLMATTFLLTVLWDLEMGIAVSVALSLVLVVEKSSRMRVKIMGRLPGTDEWELLTEESELEEEVPGVLIVRIRESLTFGELDPCWRLPIHSKSTANTGVLKERLRRLERCGCHTLVPSIC